MQEDAKKRSRAVASAQAAQSTNTHYDNGQKKQIADVASTTPRDAINTNVLQDPYVEHQAEGTSCGFRSNLNANDNNDNHSHQQPGVQPDDSQPPHLELVELHQCKASIITMNAMHLGPLKKGCGSRCGTRYCQSRQLCRYQEVLGNQLRRQGQVRVRSFILDSILAAGDDFGNLNVLKTKHQQGPDHT